MSANRIYLFYAPSIYTRNNSWPTQTDENNFIAHPCFFQPTQQLYFMTGS